MHQSAFKPPKHFPFALDPAVVQLHDYSANHQSQPLQVPTLVVAPQALHDAALADLAPRHSLMAQLQACGLARLTLIEWISATRTTADHSIGTQLSVLDTIVEGHGAPVNLIGLCQGGWLSLVYAALFPHKVSRLVLAGSPVDFHAGLPAGMRASHDLSNQFNGFGLGFDFAPFFDDWCISLSRLTRPVIRGRDIRWLWPYGLDQDWQIAETLQFPENHPPQVRALAIKALKGWDQRMLDLPAPYFWQVIQWLYRDNSLVRGTLKVLDRQVALHNVTCPLYLLAGEHDRIVPMDQVLAAARLVGTPQATIRQSLAPCGHLALFMGHDTLTRYWPMIARWLIGQDADA